MHLLHVSTWPQVVGFVSSVVELTIHFAVPSIQSEGVSWCLMKNWFNIAGNEYIQGERSVCHENLVWYCKCPLDTYTRLQFVCFTDSRGKFGQEKVLFWYIYPLTLISLYGINILSFDHCLSGVHCADFEFDWFRNSNYT